MANETATFSLQVDADAEPAKESAAALEKYRAAIENSQSALASYRKSLSLLKGSSDEVNDAKKKLKVAIEAEKAAITKNNLAVLNLRGNYDKLQRAHNKNRESFVAGKKAVNAIGGPLKDASERFAMLREILGGVTSGYGLMAVAAVGAVAGLALLAAGAAGLLAKFTAWVTTSGDSLRNMRLMREAASGNEKNARAWGHAIDWLALKVATSKDELNALVVATEKSLRGTRVTGQGMVDVWSAVAQASAAMGKDVGDTLSDILTREKLTGRFGINFKAPGISELQGTGLAFESVAKHLAKDLNIGLDHAERALVMHQVTLTAGAKAVREAVEEQFSAVNAKKMLSLDALSTKFADNLRDWASDAAQAGGALEPLLTLSKKVVDSFGLQTESGQRMKGAVREYSEKLAAGLERNGPLILQIVDGTLKFAEALIHATSAVMSFATSSTGVMTFKVALGALAMGAVAAAVALAPLLITAFGIAAPFIAAGAAVALFYDTIKDGLKIDWAFLGDSIIKGITGGMIRNIGELKSAVKGIAHDIWAAFTGPQGIDARSPSRLFAKGGKQSVQGYVLGAEEEQSRGRASKVLGQMIDVPGAGGGLATGAGRAAAAAPVKIEVHFNITGTGAKETAQFLQSQSLLDGLQHAIQSALRSAGIPTGAIVASGG